jgi:hypothetical protein
MWLLRLDDMLEKMLLPILKLLVKEILKVDWLHVNIYVKFKSIQSLYCSVWLYKLKSKNACLYFISWFEIGSWLVICRLMYEREGALKQLHNFKAVPEAANKLFFWRWVQWWDVINFKIAIKEVCKVHSFCWMK